MTPSRCVGMILLLACAFAGLARGGAPSQFGVDAPELARLGTFDVGYKTLRLSAPDQVDVLAPPGADGMAVRRERILTVDLWYPAAPGAAAPGAKTAAVSYTARFPAEPPAPPVSFTVPGIAVHDAAAAGSGYPLVVVSHGYSNDPAAMTWLTENLASKGYVVAAIRHQDPPITEADKIAEPLLRRPLDIVFVTNALRQSLGHQKLIDPARTALVGYSMGGYGVLTAAGATLDPRGVPARLVPRDLLQPYVRGGAQQSAVVLHDLKAVVAIAPAGGGTLAAWGADGLAALTTPLLLIAGDSDRTVDYTSGARAFFDQAKNARRYLLTFKGGGHSIGLNPAPEAMRARLWDQDWFEDPVWRKERINAIDAHFISAFLDEYVKGEDRDAYLNVAVSDAAAGSWPATSTASYAAYSPGAGDISVWKGFQRNHATGLELLQAMPATP